MYRCFPNHNMDVHNVLYAEMEMTSTLLIQRRLFPMIVEDINDVHDMITLIVKVLDVVDIIMEVVNVKMMVSGESRSPYRAIPHWV